MYIPAVTARGKLTSICQKFSGDGEAPKLCVADEKNAAGNHVCICTIPGLKSDLGQLASQSFAGEAASKKGAIAAACEQAWACVSVNPLLEVLKPPEDLWVTILGILSNEVRSCAKQSTTWLRVLDQCMPGASVRELQDIASDRAFSIQPCICMQALHRDLDLMGQVWLSEMYAGGRLPAAVLCKARKLFAWFKTYDAPVADNPLVLWQRISAALVQGAQKGAAHTCTSYCLI